MAEGPCAAGLQGRSHRGERRLAIYRSSTLSRPARRGRLEWNSALHCCCRALAEPALKKSDAIQTSDSDGEKRPVHFASMLRQCPDAIRGPSARQRADQGQTAPAPTPLRLKNNGTADDLSPSDPEEIMCAPILQAGARRPAKLTELRRCRKRRLNSERLAGHTETTSTSRMRQSKPKDHIQSIWRLLPA